MCVGVEYGQWVQGRVKTNSKGWKEGGKWWRSVESVGAKGRSRNWDFPCGLQPPNFNLLQEYIFTFCHTTWMLQVLLSSHMFFWDHSGVDISPHGFPFWYTATLAVLMVGKYTLPTVQHNIIYWVSTPRKFNHIPDLKYRLSWSV